MANKFWNFSKTERVAAIALTIIIVIILAVSFFGKDKRDMPPKDYKTEIEEFKSRVVPTEEDTIKKKKREPRKRTKKVYTPNKQQLAPIAKENVE